MKIEGNEAGDEEANEVVGIVRIGKNQTSLYSLLYNF